MESFDVGQHVIVTQHETVVAGNLMEMIDEGVLVRVTHKMKPLSRDIPESVTLVIREILAKESTTRLRIMAVLGKAKGWRSMDREELLEVAVLLTERETRAAMPEGSALTELNMPVMTFINWGELKTMEATTDVNLDYALTRFDATLGDELENLLTEDDRKKAEAKALAEELMKTKDEDDGSGKGKDVGTGVEGN